MPTLEVFFDYSCPYCKRGHESLLELLPSYPNITVAWRPCEAHPRPECYGLHSDLCIQAMFFVRDAQADLQVWHHRMYRACLSDRVNVESIGVICQYAEGLVDAKALKAALCSGVYKEELAKANAYAYEQSGVWAVPSYRMDGRSLDAVENVGVTKAQLREFLQVSGTKS